MNIILISTDSNYHTTKRLFHEANALGYSCEIINPFETNIRTTNDSIDKTSSYLIHRTTGVRFDNFDLDVSASFESQGYKVVNPLNCIRSFRSKQSQCIFFRKHALPSIPTIGLRGNPEQISHQDLKNTFGSFYQTESFVLKTICGAKGIGVNLINGYDSLCSILETNWAQGDQKYILQPLLKDTVEYRLFYIAGKLQGIIEKRNENDFRSNSCRGTSKVVSEKEVSSEVIELGKRAFKKSHAYYLGIDIIKWKNKYLLLELNLSPGIKYIEKLTEKNIAREIIKRLPA